MRRTAKGRKDDKSRPPNNRLMQGPFSTCSEYLQRFLLVFITGALLLVLLARWLPYSAIIPTSWFPYSTPWHPHHHYHHHHRPWIKLYNLSMLPFHSSGRRLLQQEEQNPVKEKRQYHFPPAVDCAQWMARADDTTNNNDNMEWIDPYQGKIMIPYTLPLPAPSNLQIGLYGKEVAFVTTEVQSKFSRVRHDGQSMFLTILKRYQVDTTAIKPATVPMVVQVGGQIGWFSLQAAALGFDVHVVEENPSHVLRMCRNIQLNQEANVDTTTTTTTTTSNRSPLVLHLYHAVVVGNVGTTSIPPPAATTTTTTTLSTQVDLSGRLGRGVFAHQIEFIPAFLKSLYPRHQQQHPSLLPIPSTTLDHWAESHSFLGTEENNIVLLKIDVAPGHETQVLHGAQRLLKSKQVWNIMVDIKISSSSSSSSVGRRPHEEEEENILLQEGSSHRQLIQLLLDSGYQLYNQWDKTKKKTTAQDGNDVSFVPNVASNNNNSDNDDVTKKAVVDSIVNLTHQSCTQGAKGCHMWWKRRGTIDHGP